MEANLRTAGLGDDIDVYATGLGSEAGTFILQSEPGGGNGAVALQRARSTPSTQGPAVLSHEQTIPIIRLDDVAVRGGRIALIKMDIEGMEMDVLAGGERTVDAHRPVIYGEFSQRLLRGRRVSGEPLAWAASHRY